jgi:hypothetical protein
VTLLRIPTGVKKRARINRRCGKHKLASIRATRGNRYLTPKLPRGDTRKNILLREGNKLLNYLTNTAGREVVNLSRLIPAPLKRRQLIGAAMRLRQEVESGKVLAPDIPTVNTQVGVSGTEEHMNVMRDYQVDLHSKLGESEENRAHMSAYINFEHEAEGGEDLGEYDPSYQTPDIAFNKALKENTKLSDRQDPRGHRGPGGPRMPEDPRGPEGPRVQQDPRHNRDPQGPSCYIPPDIQGEECVMKDGKTLQENLRGVCNEYKSVFNTKVHPTPAYITPMKLEVDETIWNDRANAAAPR